MAGIRVQGKYQECEQLFKRLAKKFAFQICGPAFLLYYDKEFKKDDADFEACLSIRRGVGDDTISVREFPGGNCLSLMHHGPYDGLETSYEKILNYCHDHKVKIISPIREVYVKGPGMIFKGNSKKYITEIQIFYMESEEDHNVT